MSRAGTKYRDRKRNQVCVCAFCKNVFYATRRDAKTCSVAHRKAYERLMKKEVFERVTERREIPIKKRGKEISQLEIIVDRDIQRIARRLF